MDSGKNEEGENFYMQSGSRALSDRRNKNKK